MQLYLIRVPEYWRKTNDKSLKKSKGDIVYEKWYDYTKATPIKKLLSNNSSYILEEVKKITYLHIDERDIKTALSHLSDHICNYRIVEDIFLYNPYCKYEYDKEEIETIDKALRIYKLNKVLM